MPTDMRHLVIGYHGTDEERFQSIQQDGFLLGTKVAWLGSGVYFWEQDRNKAIWWAREKNKFTKPVAIRAQLDITDSCLDLTTDDGLKKYAAALEELFKKEAVLAAFREFLRQKPNHPDAFCLNLICSIFKYSSVRALVMRGTSKYNEKVPRFTNRFSTTPSMVVVDTSLIVAMRNPATIQGADKVWP